MKNGNSEPCFCFLWSFLVFLGFLSVLFLFLWIPRVLAVEDQIIVTQTVSGLFQCNDGTDNDSDTLIDYPTDPDCASTSDDSEAGSGGGGGGGDISPPVIIDLSPLDDSTGVSISTILSFTFNEPVILQNGNIILKKASNGSVVETISAISGQVSLSGSVATITLSSPLEEGVSYFIELDTGLARDAAGNLFAGLSGSTAWNFTTSDTTPPNIVNVSVVPSQNSAFLSWNTTELSLSSYSWGTTTEYGSGSGTETSYLSSHSATLPGLSESTLYYYRILAQDSFGNISSHIGSFTTLSASDGIPPANPSGFAAVANASSIALSWTNPPDADFSFVRILRSSVSYPLSPTGGTVVYQGSGGSFLDTDVAFGVQYYYTAFASDASGNFSSGSLASAMISPVPPPGCPPDCPPPPPPPPSSPSPPSGGGTPDPPVVPPPSVPPSSPPTNPPPFVLPEPPASYALRFSDFDFFETFEGKEERLSVSRNGQVRINTGATLRASLRKEIAPPETNLVIFSIENQKEGKTSAFLLRLNNKKTAYEGAVSVSQPGEYGARVDIYGAENELVAENIRGEISARKKTIFSFFPEVLPGVPKEVREDAERVITAVTPVAVPVSVAVGVGQSAVLAANLHSLYDLYLFLLKLLGMILAPFRKKKPVPWGTVYDAVTKQPIDPAYVVLASTDGSVSKNAITDLDGRYGFLVPSGKYTLVANKTHYRFPSQKLLGAAKDEVYDNLYFGTAFSVKEGDVVRYSIPLDPLEFDWNEFAKNRDQLFYLRSRKNRARTWFFGGIFYIGLALSAWTTAVSPTLFNGAVLSFYLAVILFQGIWKRIRPVRRIVNKKTGRPLPFAILSLSLPEIGVLIKKVVTDEMGRFYILVTPGAYDVSVEEKQDDGTYKRTALIRGMELKGGVFKKDIEA